jgi:2'-phosphotransferase
MSEKKKNLRKLSHRLSYVLRHGALDMGLEMTADGYVPVDSLLILQHPKFIGNQWTLQDIRDVVSDSDKQRFKLREKPASDYGQATQRTVERLTQTTTATSNMLLCIRANQGHTISFIKPELLLVRLSAEELRRIPTIVHGTYSALWPAIQISGGLSRMKRTHIHCASGLIGENGVISGMRRGCDVYIYINAEACADAGVVFYRSDNGVLLTAGIKGGILPCKYFSHVTDAGGNEILVRSKTEGSRSCLG